MHFTEIRFWALPSSSIKVFLSKDQWRWNILARQYHNAEVSSIGWHIFVRELRLQVFTNSFSNDPCRKCILYFDFNHKLSKRLISQSYTPPNCQKYSKNANWCEFFVNLCQVELRVNSRRERSCICICPCIWGYHRFPTISPTDLKSKIWVLQGKLNTIMALGIFLSLFLLSRIRDIFCCITYQGFKSSTYFTSLLFNLLIRL